jgi:hypothetical protein
LRLFPRARPTGRSRVVRARDLPLHRLIPVYVVMCDKQLAQLCMYAPVCRYVRMPNRSQSTNQQTESNFKKGKSNPIEGKARPIEGYLCMYR